MIAFFPEIYQDELLYSQIARYHSRSGYTRYVFSAEEIFKNGSLTLPSIEFVNQYTSDVMKWITKIETGETIIEQHTMYPAYIRFLPKMRRIEAVNGVINGNRNWKKLMCLPVLNEKNICDTAPNVLMKTEKPMVKPIGTANTKSPESESAPNITIF